MHLSLRFNAAHPTLKATTAGSSDSSMDFDVVLVGSSMTRTVTLHTEALPVVVQGIAVAPLPSADSQAPGRTAKEASPRSASLRTAQPHTMFAVAAPQLPLTLPAYGSITIPVTFSATAVVARFTTALVVEWDSGQPLQVPVAAAGDRFEMLWRVAPLRERSGVDTLRASMAEVRGEGAVLLQRMYAAFRTVIPQPASGLQRPTAWKRYPEDDDTMSREDGGATAAVDDVLPDPSTPSSVVSFGVVQVREGARVGGVCQQTQLFVLCVFVVLFLAAWGVEVALHPVCQQRLHCAAHHPHRGLASHPTTSKCAHRPSA